MDPRATCHPQGSSFQLLLGQTDTQARTVAKVGTKTPAFLTCLPQHWGSHLLPLRASGAFSISHSPDQPEVESRPADVWRPGREGPPHGEESMWRWFRSTGLICKPPRGDGLVLGERPGKMCFLPGKTQCAGERALFPDFTGPVSPSSLQDSGGCAFN